LDEVVTIQTPPAKKPTLEILIVGDCMLGRGLDQTLRRYPPQYPWGDTLPLFRRADVRLCNLECVLSDRGEPWSEYEKVFHFRSAARNVTVLTTAGINMVSIANNHVLDYGHVALLQMLEVLDQAGIAHSGAGADWLRASMVARHQVQGWRLGLLAFTDNEAPWEAASPRPGTFYVPVALQDPRAQNLIRIVRERNDLDTLIISAHWGSNWGYVPPEEHVQLAHALIDAGADIIFGHSSHVFRGIEFYKNRPILYSTGNFVDDYAIDPVERNDQSFIFLVELNAEGPPRLRLYPTMIDHCQARLARETEAQSIAGKMQSLCAPFRTLTCWDPEHRLLEVTARIGDMELVRVSG
jgi:poly-gamma-glutamate capsule biosynthesis protein CapA/YwtB (metallophosphatase superfamily)